MAYLLFLSNLVSITIKRATINPIVAACVASTLKESLELFSMISNSHSPQNNPILKMRNRNPNLTIELFISDELKL